MQLGFYVDTAICSGCKACMVSCKDKNDLNVGRNFRRVYEYAGGSCTDNGNGVFSQSVFAYYTSISCNHCDTPACTKACPTGAMHKRIEDGLVLVHDDICIGCSSCAQACPYDAPQLDEARGKMTKCDGCIDRLNAGKQPMCVDSCIHRALDFGPIDELRAKYGETAEIAPLPAASITKPNLILRVHPDGQPVGSGAGSVVNPNEV
ncbi:DMSO/selenate family reductase complex B subunit [uncultured Shewanella sp.]|uniref:DMSO/selenate family reductase complex B subunit n=1 Tax=uncultured Shewanella sp. TaxID=173975 RepID=UPI0026274844|nr:DMSO/selenate family reductase complex B subunit [uncultured Shewanella sp.]